MILLYLLILVFIMVVLNLFYVKEGFENEARLDAQASLRPEVVASYNKFVAFYNPFLINWEKAITTAVSLEVEQAPQVDPTDATPPTAPSPPPVTRNQMNNYINQLSSKLNKPLPSVTDPLPKDINASTLPSIIPLLPKDVAAFQNALDWMNQQMKDSQQNLAGALQGIPPTIEGFDATTTASAPASAPAPASVPAPTPAPLCQEVSQCLANDPKFVAQMAQQIEKQQEEQKQESTKEQQEELLARITPFLQDADLVKAGATNKDLANQLTSVQQQAESGELYSKISLPDTEPEMKLTAPTGGFALAEMQKQNPQQYNQLKDNYKQWFDVKQLIEQINQSL